MTRTASLLYAFAAVGLLTLSGIWLSYSYYVLSLLAVLASLGTMAAGFISKARARRAREAQRDK